MIEKIIKDFNKVIIENLNKIIIEGLKLKGYTFKNRLELILFIEKNCSTTKNKEYTIYKVKEEPFLLRCINKNFNIDTTFDKETKEIKMTSFNGYFKYI
jgi:hypothetical protein